MVIRIMPMLKAKQKSYTISLIQTFPLFYNYNTILNKNVLKNTISHDRILPLSMLNVFKCDFDNKNNTDNNQMTEIMKSTICYFLYI